MFEKIVEQAKAMASQVPAIDDVLKKDKIPASKAYMVSKYGEDISKEELLKDFFDKARTLIQLKTSKGKFSAILELNEDINCYLTQIIEHYRNFGYNVIVIDENTNISNKYNDKASRITMTLIIVTWDNPKEQIKEEKK